MASIVSIIGLGEIGASFAMALKEKGDSFRVIGSDILKSAEERAKEAGWVDEIIHNVYDATAEADLVILAVPSDETKATLELIGHDLRDSAVVLDCCPTKTAAAGWARQFMSRPESYVGIWPGIASKYMSEPQAGAKSAHADLFQGAAMYICPDSKTSETTVNLASGLARMLEMECSFTDPAELDGILAADWHLPVMLGYALVGCLAGRSGWADGKKACGKEFRSAAAPLDNVIDQEEAGTALMNNRENNIRVINEYIAELKKVRDLLQDKDSSGLRNYMTETGNQVDQWLKDYRQSAIAAGDSSPKIEVTAAETFRQTFFGGLFRNKKEK